MKLTVLERLLLLNALPGEGDITTIRILRKLRESLSFTEAEHKVYQIKQIEDKVAWDATIEQNADIDIGEKATDLVVETLKKLNEQKKLTDSYISLWDKFVDRC